MKLDHPNPNYGLSKIPHTSNAYSTKILKYGSQGGYSIEIQITTFSHDRLSHTLTSIEKKQVPKVLLVDSIVTTIIED